MCAGEFFGSIVTHSLHLPENLRFGPGLNRLENKFRIADPHVGQRLLNCAGHFCNGEPGFSFAQKFLGGGDKGFSALNLRPHGLHVFQQCRQTAGFKFGV